MEIQSRQNCVHTKSSCYDVKCTNVMLYVYTVVPRRYAHPKKSYLRCKSGGGRDNEDAQ